jgi:hypothetical protein
LHSQERHNAACGSAMDAGRGHGVGVREVKEFHGEVLRRSSRTFVHVALLTTKVRTAQRSGCVVYTPFQQQRLMGCPWPATTLLRTPRLTASCPRPAQPFERTTHSGTLTHPPPQTESCSLGKTLLLRARQALNTQACVSPSARCLLATGIVAPLR